jgi:hypothetical protein
MAKKKVEGNYVVHRKMDGNGDHHVKCNKSFSERQVLYVFSHLWNLGEKEHKSKGSIRDVKEEKEEREGRIRKGNGMSI